MTQKNWVGRLNRAESVVENKAVAEHEAEQRDATQTARREFVKDQLAPLAFHTSQTGSGNLYSSETVTGEKALQIRRDAEALGLVIQTVSHIYGESNVEIKPDDVVNTKLYKLRIPEGGSLSASRVLAAGLLDAPGRSGIG